MRQARGGGRIAFYRVVAVSTLTLGLATAASAQTLNSLNRRLDELQPQVSAALSNSAEAGAVIDQLDQAEAEFAQIVEGERNDREDLVATYDRLESMLSRMYNTYEKKKDDCVQAIDEGGSCDYSEPEQLALRALYPLSWLRFEGAAIHGNDPATAKRLLNEAIDGFTDSSLLILSPELIRENLLGRAYAERELGKYDRTEYQKAIADFRKIIAEGESRQYQAAEQGLATTYAAMGRSGEAQSLSSQLSMSGPMTRAQRNGIEMLRLRDMFRGEAATTDPAKRAAAHKQIVDFIRDREDDHDGWAIAIASAAQYCDDPIAEFGASRDPFESWFLANVLYYKHQNLEAAKYYWQAAQSGRYIQGYKYAAEIYYAQGHTDMVEKIVDQLAQQPANPDAQWASYMKYKIPRLQWERGGMRDDRLEQAWVTAANEYLQRYPRGQYAYDPRFRLAERLQKRKDYVGAAREYEQVTGNADYEFTAYFNAADAYSQALGGNAALETPLGANSMAPANPKQAAIRAAALKDLQAAINLEPTAEREASGAQRTVMHDSRGRAIYMLALLMEGEPQPDYRLIASDLANFESQYPGMKEHFKQTFEWRVTALEKTDNFTAAAREIHSLVGGSAVPLDIDYVKEIGLDFWKAAQAREAQGDKPGAVEDARLTAETYDYFENQVNQGKLRAKDLTGTLSILGEAYLAANEPAQAEAIFEQVVKADPGSPDGNAGLATLAQKRKDYKDALDLWTRVESVAAESDPLFFEAKYRMAEIFAMEGNNADACNKLEATRDEHPNLGSPEMKIRWSELEHRLCSNHTES